MQISLESLEHYNWGANCEAWHLLKSDELSVIKERMPKSTAEVLHYHKNTQQLFYILSGVASFEMNGEMTTVKSNESIHVPKQTLHKISNQGETDLEFLVISQPKSHGDRVDIIDYSEDLKAPIKKLNEEWLEKFFKVEPNDVIQLSSPTEEIINKGGHIYYARHKGEIVGTVSLMIVDENVYELAKMAVTDSAQGLGIGNILMQHCFNESKRLGIDKLVLYSNRTLSSAIHLYEKYGFREVELEAGHYERANIKMEKVI
ncbi:MAG: Transcriptional regulator, MarR family [Bacteroidetes bacterium]|jgi:mannose-6-phosphate isomerase-like protein (cupin superfamily)/N-acetylglutamate synthase-like GNAT family acetyltransferase|nr:Transcriptional regulator, MarR family [Bacteroidota bacterium]MDF2453173.1 Transcriptional regulator, MarR family [Bacteroidota bacterium]